MQVTYLGDIKDGSGATTGINTSTVVFSGSGFTSTYLQPSAGGLFLIALTYHNATGSAVTITDNGGVNTPVPYTLVDKIVTPSDSGRDEIHVYYGLIQTPPAPDTLTISTGNAADVIHSVGITQYVGAIDLNAPIATVSHTCTRPNGPGITTGEDGDYIWSLVIADTNITPPSPLTGWSTQGKASYGLASPYSTSQRHCEIGYGQSVPSVAGAITPPFSNTTATTWLGLTVAIKALGGPASFSQRMFSH